MGGFGSGNRCRYGNKDTCEAQCRVDIRYMRKMGLLRPYSQGTLSWTRNGEDNGWIRYHCHDTYLELDFKTRHYGAEEWEPVQQRVQLEEVEQPFGGTRSYFRCPRCDRRCMVLYSNGRFYCRTCQNLAYQSQNDDSTGRAQRRVSKICEKLGGSGGFSELLPIKPKGMHWKTYDRLARQWDRHQSQVENDLAGLILKLGGKL